MVPSDNHNRADRSFQIRKFERDLWIHKEWKTIEEEVLKWQEHSLSFTFNRWKGPTQVWESLFAKCSLILKGTASMCAQRLVFFVQWNPDAETSEVRGSKSATDVLSTKNWWEEKESYWTNTSSRGILETSWSICAMTQGWFWCDRRSCRQEIQRRRVQNQLWVVPIILSCRPIDEIHRKRSCQN